jgi:ferrous iron transport protein B
MICVQCGETVEFSSPEIERLQLQAARDRGFAIRWHRHEMFGPLRQVFQEKSGMKTLVLVGNPNVGKSVIFGRLTGKYATVSNYPGTTVEVSSGVSWLAGEKWRVVDTPGVNSLWPSSEDERVTRDFLLKERPDVVLNVIDSKNLQRGLMTTLELSEFEIPLVVVLNLADEALDRGIAVDAVALSRHLGCPVVATVATTGRAWSN